MFIVQDTVICIFSQPVEVGATYLIVLQIALILEQVHASLVATSVDGVVVDGSWEPVGALPYQTTASRWISARFHSYSDSRDVCFEFTCFERQELC